VLRRELRARRGRRVFDRALRRRAGARLPVDAGDREVESCRRRVVAQGGARARDIQGHGHLASREPAVCEAESGRPSARVPFVRQQRGAQARRAECAVPCVRTSNEGGRWGEHELGRHVDDASDWRRAREQTQAERNEEEEEEWKGGQVGVDAQAKEEDEAQEQDEEQD